MRTNSTGCYWRQQCIVPKKKKKILFPWKSFSLSQSTVQAVGFPRCFQFLKRLSTRTPATSPQPHKHRQPPPDKTPLEARGKNTVFWNNSTSLDIHVANEERTGSTRANPPCESRQQAGSCWQGGVSPVRVTGSGCQPASLGTTGVLLSRKDLWWHYPSSATRNVDVMRNLFR